MHAPKIFILILASVWAAFAQADSVVVVQLEKGVINMPTLGGLVLPFTHK